MTEFDSTAACDPGDICETTMAPDTDRRQSDGSHRCADGAHRMRAQRQHHPEVENPPDLSRPSPARELPIPDQVKLEVAVRRERVAVAAGAALWDGRRGRRVRKRERGQRQRGHHAAARDVGVSLGRLCRRRRGGCAGRGHRDPFHSAVGGGFPAWAVVAVVLAVAGGAVAIIVTRRRRSV